MTHSTRPGFTLIEIMIVIMIIGIIAAGAFGGMRYLQRVKESSTRSKLAAVDTMLETYNTVVGKFPTDLQELIDGPSEPQFQKRWGEPIASAEELRDAWQKELVYNVAPKGTRPPYELFSTGSKGDAQIFSPVSQQT